MRARIDNDVLLLHKDDVPPYKKKGSVVRNNYFWTLRAIAGRSNPGQDWEFESEVWLALRRVLIFFSESGYLGLRETTLEFPIEDGEIPDVFRLIATWQDPDHDPEEELDELEN